MRIENLKYINSGSQHGVTASISWEENDRPVFTMYFYTEKEEQISLNPDAFLTACYIPAMYLGEKRIKVDGLLDSELKRGTNLNMNMFQKWYGRKYKTLSIEENKSVFEYKKNVSNAGLFFSGGVDSIYSLLLNRKKYKNTHPLFINDCFIVHGFDIYEQDGNDDHRFYFDRAVKSTKKITEDVGAKLIPVFTNVRQLFFDYSSFCPRWFHGAALASVGHCFASRINSIFIASSFTPSMLVPYGSHPLLDLNFSSSHLKVIHDDLSATIDKLRLISESEVSFQNIRTCYQNNEKFLNCCHCEKCIRIMLTLMALGVLDRNHAFPLHEISSSSLISAMREHSEERHFKGLYLELVPFLRNRGHQDLVNVILNENRLKSKIRRFDECYFQGKLKSLLPC